MKLTFLGATHEVTGSCTLIELSGRYGLVDCGMEQGRNVFVNEPLPVPASQIDFVLLTHAHIDHSGNLPLLYKQGFRGQIFATTATCHLCEIMLRDCANIQVSDAEWKNRKARRAGEPPVEPVYTMEDADGAISRLRPCGYDQPVQVGENIAVRFVDVGHLMGSASIEVYLREGDVSKKLVFSGDIGNTGQPIINDPHYVLSGDYVVTESTYGDRLHEKGERNSVQYLADCIQRVLDRGGNVVIPSFAVGRTQEILYFIREIKLADMVRGHGEFPVYIDSPLANEATGIFLQCDRQFFDSETLALLDAGINPLVFPGLKIAVSSEESKQINFDPTPKVIISASGMCDAGRIRHHLKHNLWRSECMVLFAGYQAVGTTGRAIRDGRKQIRLFGETVTVNAEISYLPGKSGHADKEGLLRWINAFTEKPQMVFVNHGEDAVVKSYAACLTDEYGYTASAPYSGAVFDLISGQYLRMPEGVPVARQTAKQQRNSAVFASLLAACERLSRVASGCQNIPNKELAKFTGQINSLADKWSGWSKGK
ncbi:MAG: MBL fold metallo-hydrolase [Oscillospiraceae bacterium]|nr:MBL fold metallo-hydrolase [Oscillospiraceae bacterium]